MTTLYPIQTLHGLRDRLLPQPTCEIHPELRLPLMVKVLLCARPMNMLHLNTRQLATEQS